MPNKNKLTLLIFLSAIVFASASCPKVPDFGVCENTVEKEVPSPNGELKAVIFDRGCGATVGFITGISIVSFEKTISSEDAGNTLFAEKVYREFSYQNGQIQYGKTNFDVKWIRDGELLVSHSESKRISKKESYNNINIKYELTSK